MQDIYEGEFLNNRRHGVGVFRSAETGALFHGEFVDDDMIGAGRITYADGGAYMGGIVKLKRHGQVRVWPLFARDLQF